MFSLSITRKNYFYAILCSFKKVVSFQFYSDVPYLQLLSPATKERFFHEWLVKVRKGRYDNAHPVYRRANTYYLTGTYSEIVTVQVRKTSIILCMVTYRIVIFIPIFRISYETTLPYQKYWSGTKLQKKTTTFDQSPAFRLKWTEFNRIWTKLLHITDWNRSDSIIKLRETLSCSVITLHY